MERIVVIGLGYVGLPLALGFARHYHGTIGFDVKRSRITALRRGIDETGETGAEELREANIEFTDDPERLRGATVFIIAVPTPVDSQRRPDLSPLRLACETIASALTPGAVVVVESTVYPGVTEEFCGPIIAQASGLTQSRDFTLGYSPERINPGDREHRLETVVKVVAGESAAVCDRIAKLYAPVCEAGIFKASGIKVAEAAKVIENTQRDLNIALMNELAMIFDKMDIPTRDVLAVAETKWNFQKFRPGLVGGHCIGVDPYYLTAKAQEIGLHPEIILAGRRINDTMGAFVAGKLVRLLTRSGRSLRQCRIGVMGLAFKENVSDLRNSKVIDIVRELAEFGATVLVHDPHVSPNDANAEFGLTLAAREDLFDLDALVLAVPHRSLLAEGNGLLAAMQPDGIVIDVKSALNPGDIPQSLTYWSL